MMDGDRIEPFFLSLFRQGSLNLLLSLEHFAHEVLGRRKAFQEVSSCLQKDKLNYIVIEGSRKKLEKN